MVAGFHVFSMRDSDGTAPSLHTEFGIMDKERPAPEQRQGLLGAAAGVEQDPALIGDDELRLPGLAPGDVGLELIGQIMHIDDGGLDAGHSQPVEHMIEQSPSRERHQWLRHAESERTHPLALAGCQHHRRSRLSHGREAL